MRLRGRGLVAETKRQAGQGCMQARLVVLLGKISGIYTVGRAILGGGGAGSEARCREDISRRDLVNILPFLMLSQ